MVVRGGRGEEAWDEGEGEGGGWGEGKSEKMEERSLGGGGMRRGVWVY